MTIRNGSLSATGPLHGGDLHQAIQRYGIPRSDWLDLSTGISPLPWPVPSLPVDVWQRLPEDDGELEAAAQDYYGVNGLPVPGSQWAIQHLPTLFTPTRVWIAEQSYEEHRFWWQQQHALQPFQTLPAAGDLQSGDIVIAINPNNPTAHFYPRQQLLELADALRHRNGWLVVDEAFMDATPEASLLPESISQRNLILLRSMGKFFGLAGIRVGFVFAHPDIRTRLQHQLGPWAISHPARRIAIDALRDTRWQQTARRHLQQQSQALTHLLCSVFPASDVNATALFVSVKAAPAQAERWQDQLARQGIWIRVFPHWNRLRFGLANGAGLERLKIALSQD